LIPIRTAARKPKLPKRIKSFRAFAQEGMRVDKAMRQSGWGYEAPAVHEYLAAKARRGRPRRPKAVRWRG
jgi:hypothetical protein